MDILPIQLDVNISRMVHFLREFHFDRSRFFRSNPYHLKIHTLFILLPNLMVLSIGDRIHFT